MPTKSQQPRKTTMVPVTTMEQIPILNEGERAELMAALKEAEAEIKAGEFVEYDPGAFKARLLDNYRRAKK